MGKPSDQIRCEDWTASYVLDDAVLSFGSFVESEVKRYANHTPESHDKKAKGKPPTMENVNEYQRALLEGTPFQLLKPKRKLKAARPPGANM